MPGWAVSQGRVLNQLVGMVKGLQTNFRDVKAELHEVRDELAQVRMHAGLAHAEAEEAMEKVTMVEDQMNEMSGKMLTRTDVETIVADTMNGDPR